eukprot:SAG31_NODE_1254_length_9087_cov_12.553071_5_plen_141_part_00
MVQNRCSQPIKSFYYVAEDTGVAQRNGYGSTVVMTAGGDLPAEFEPSRAAAKHFSARYHYLILSHTILYYLILFYTISYYLTLSHTISYYLILSHTMPGLSKTGAQRARVGWAPMTTGRTRWTRTAWPLTILLPAWRSVS